ncbi:MAG: ISNCY family transposase [Candidatus Daviesbacteria bacterium]|nr:ISNCY family transposase [Candidatus Daviesbacteria bacterium]
MADSISTPEEQYKFDVITKVIKKEIKPGLAAKLLSISTRQIRRLKALVRKDGLTATVHKLKGKPGNHRIDPTVKQKALTAIKETYSDFKPTLATEKLEENHSIRVSYGTTRFWMIEAGLWKPHKQKEINYKSWRPRKEYFGEMQQFDGSYHYWFENRYCDQLGEPIEVCLLASIDDATGKITKAVFSANEGVVAVFTFWKEYCLKHGKPLAIYLDKFSTYKINHKAAVDNSELLTQFQRAMQTLGIQLITAHSPQAKGRIERLFQTLQDRLIKEMRLANINTPEQGNIFLANVFLPSFNNRFAVVPAKTGDLHKPLTEIDKDSLESIFSIQSTRRINNDFTIQFKNNWYQLAEIQPTTVRPKEAVIVEERLDGTIHFNLQKHYLNYTVLPERPKKITKQPVILTRHKLNWKPPANHPWRQYDKIKS